MCMNLEHVWISRVPRESFAPKSGPLSGQTFAIKDNIDLAGVPTTAGCPAYAYTPAQSAPVVERLIDAGAVPLGKTNMDQFATGLVGTRSPYGACSCVFDERYISGGSSSGSAVAVASGQVNFALGTDTAGSGRVPAAFNNLVGMKPTRGLLSTSGVVPACRSLDCVTILTRTSADARRVFEAALGFDPSDPYSRVPNPGQGAVPWAGGPFRFGVPSLDQLEFFGDDEAFALYKKAVADIESLGGAGVEIDYAPFRAAADLLYSGPWVAERLAAIGPFLEQHSGDMHPVVRDIIAGARRFSAADAFNAEYKLRELRRAADMEWAGMDVLVLPTTGTIYTHEAVAADPVRLNTNLGYYTNFVNLLDLAAIAVPAGFRSNGLPFGISLISPAFTDLGLLSLAGRYLREPAATLGSRPAGQPVETAAPGCIAVAVVGAHLSGQPLNWQLTLRGARLLKTCRTAPGYRFYALEGAIPKPGLVRQDDFRGPGIEVEIWAVPEDRFGSYVAAVPPPLGIGNAVLDNGETVKCFICEPYAIANAPEITHFGSWRKYLESKG
jgi:allophanate hydrolase